MPRPVLAPRKRPVQERSRATVDAIVEATAYVLVRRGAAGLTTKAIAARAGVNIASLYQYFPNKESITAELRRRHVAAQRAAVRTAWTELRGASIEAIVGKLVSIGIAAHAVEPALHEALTQLMPGRVDMPADDDELAVSFRRALAETDVPDVELALWIIDTVSHAAIHRAALERPALLADPRFASELTALVTGYLVRPAGRSKRPRRAPSEATPPVAASTTRAGRR